MTTVLVTGWPGFIGSRVTDRLLADGHAVVGIDSFEDCHPRAIQEANLEGAHAGRDTLAETDLVDLAAVSTDSGPPHDDERSRSSR